MIGVGVNIWGQGRISLRSLATAYLAGIEPYHWFDFVNDRCLYAGNDVGGVSGATGYSFSRASVGTYRNLDGTTTQFSSGQLRRGNRGVLIEGARTNLFLNSATGATQNVTVAAAAHTLSFEGTGTITLSGVSTAGPLVGTGALNRVSLTFTPTAGTLTLTITGTVERVNLEAGAFGSSWIPTSGSSVTRAADVLTTTAGVSYPATLWAEFERAVDAGSLTELYLTLSEGASDNHRSAIMNSPASDLGRYFVGTGGVTQADITAGSLLTLGVVQKVAGRTATNSAQMASNGSLGTEDTSVTLPNTPTLITFGAPAATATNQIFGYIRRIAVFNSALSDAQLEAITT